MNADNILFRCSALGLIMTEPRDKAAKERGELGETCKKYLVEKYVYEKYGREKDIQNKYTKKGLQVEEDAITLYSRLKKKYYLKNEENLANEFICGTPDIYEGESIDKATHIPDIKSSWDLFTFAAAKNAPLNKDYYWQAMGYMILTGAQTATVAYCLIDTPHALIYDECQKLKWKMGVINPDSDPLYLKACEELEKNMRFEDIPMEERMFEQPVKRDDKSIQKIYDRVKQCREYMNQHFFANETLTEQLLKSVA